MFGAFVIVYLFLGGFGSGMLLLSSLASLAFHRSLNRSELETWAFDAWRNRCFVWGFVIVACGALCLLLDLGRPERFVMLFLRPSAASVLSYGAIFLTALVAVAAFLLVANYCDGHLRVSAAARKVAEAACTVLSVLVMTYTGVYLMSTQAVAFWSTPLIVTLFVASAMSMGLSGCNIAGSLLRDTWMLEDLTSGLRWIHVAVLVAEVGMLAWFIVDAMARGGRAADSCALLFTGDLEVWFLGGVAMCGLAIPLIRGIVPLSSGQLLSFPISDALCILGGLALRLCLVSAGLH